MTLEELLDRLERVKKNGSGWIARCPAHEDSNPSLSVGEGTEGQPLLHCHAGCTFEEIVAALRIEPSDLSGNGLRTAARIVATYDYVDEEGALLFQVVRKEPKDFLQRRPNGRGGWIWKLGKTRKVLYRLPQVLEAVAEGKTVYIAEGEEDVHALERAGVVATTNPAGVGKWQNQFAKVLRDTDVVVIQDKDDPGRKHAARIADTLDGVARSVRVVEAAQGKDARDHFAAGKNVEELVPRTDRADKLTTAAEGAPLSQKVVSSAKLTPPDKPGLADEENILASFTDDLKTAGLAGEQTGAQITYLALTSRTLPWGKPTNRLVSVIGKGSSSTGKSYMQTTVLRFFPDEAYFDLGSMSKKFLLYTEESFENRFIVIPEWSAIANDEEIVASLRTLLSEGRLVHGTVDGDGRREARRIEKPGPTGLLMTTTASSTDTELETRCLSFLTDDTPEQTRRVYKALAALEDEDDLGVDFDRWHALQRWIAGAGEHRVVIPYVKQLAEKMPTTATRLRRDFVSLCCLVRAHSILHQANRERDLRGRIVATEADYAAVHGLMDKIVGEAVDANVSKATRETVAAVNQLVTIPGAHTSIKKISDQLGIGRTATYDRVKRAVAAGFLVNQATTQERGWKVALGSDLPTDGASFLPKPEEVCQFLSVRPF